MQDALQQVFREKDAAFRERDSENAFSETPLEAKCGGMRQIMVLVTQRAFLSSLFHLAPFYGNKVDHCVLGEEHQIDELR